ncbi:MAG TPA: hypothetical protein VGG57_22635 [Stellaceae bacterium]|jgi:hypothetical protein
MTKDQIEAVLRRVPTWSQERQQQLVEIALEIEAECEGAPYEASADELRAIDEAWASGIASPEKIAAAFARLRWA